MPSQLGLCSKTEVPVANCDSSELFDWKSVPVIDLSLPAATWKELKKNARDEQYTQAQLTFEGHLIGEVGLRFKGGYGTLENCFDAKGNQICAKLSMKLKFNEYDEKGRFFGLKRLNLHSMIADSSQLHDRISYRTYREMGIMAPRSSWATVTVNGESQGLYAMIEQIDGRFTNDRWPDAGDGNLYKEAMIGPDTSGYYAEHLETNETTATHDAFIEFSKAMNGATPTERRGVIGTYMDLDYLAKYMAVDDAIYNWDGITGIYTAPDRSFTLNHNYFIYQEPTRPYFWFIPWDLDNTLSLNNGFGVVPNWGITPADCSKVIPVFGGQNHVLPPGCDPFFQALAEDRTGYLAAVNQLLAGPFAEASLLQSIDQDAAFIAAAVAADPLGSGTVAWEAAVMQLKSDVPRLRERLKRIAAGELLVPLTIDPNALNDFETFTAESTQAGPVLMANPGSTVAASVSFASPLSGTRDLRVDFEYRNTSKAWEQWLYFSIPTNVGEFDSRAMTGLRLTVRADIARTLRVDLESPANTAGNAGIRVGWDVPVTTNAKTVELLLADAEVPSWTVDQGIDPQDDLAKIRASVTGVAFHPYCTNRNGQGFLPDGVTDKGWAEIDDLQFY